MGKPTLVETNEVTIVDFGKIANAITPLKADADVLKIIETLKDAFSHRRVVYIINHGIEEQEVTKIYSLFNKFLALPDGVKEEFKSKGSKDYHGYVSQNVEQFYTRDKFEIRESLNIIGKDRPFPDDQIPEFSQCVDDIIKKFHKISNLLLELFAIGMDANPDALLNYHKNMWNHLKNSTNFRILHYPPVEEEPHPGIIRCGEHSDYGSFTLLMQDSEGGLEVCGENGEWRRVGHIPGAIFMNPADMLEIWSSGLYKATLHRVVVPEEVKTRSQSRHAIAYFILPDNDVTVKPVHSTPGEEVREYNVGEYIWALLDRSEMNRNSQVA